MGLRKKILEALDGLQAAWVEARTSLARIEANTEQRNARAKSIGTKLEDMDRRWTPWLETLKGLLGECNARILNAAAKLDATHELAHDAKMQALDAALRAREAVSALTELRSSVGEIQARSSTNAQRFDALQHEVSEARKDLQEIAADAASTSLRVTERANREGGLRAVVRDLVEKAERCPSEFATEEMRSALRLARQYVLATETHSETDLERIASWVEGLEVWNEEQRAQRHRMAQAIRSRAWAQDKAKDQRN